MTGLVLSDVWTENSVVQQVQGFANSDFTWSKINAEPSALTPLRKAAVLVPLFVKDGEIYVWLTLRSQHLRKDPGDVAFPGGKQDDGEDEVDTCLREAHEEIGLSLTDVQIIAPVPPRISRHNLLVSPVIGLINADFKPEINTAEVDVAFSLPLRRFLCEDGHRSVTHEFRGNVYNLPFFDDYINGRLITTWGLTALVCVEVAMAIFEQNPDFGTIHDKWDHFKIDPKDPFAYQLKFLEMYKLEHKSKL